MGFGGRIAGAGVLVFGRRLVFLFRGDPVTKLDLTLSKYSIEGSNRLVSFLYLVLSEE